MASRALVPALKPLATCVFATCVIVFAYRYANAWVFNPYSFGKVVQPLHLYDIPHSIFYIWCKRFGCLIAQFGHTHAVR